MLTKNEKGQTLILMLIVTVISLTIGVAISSRAVSTLKQTSYTAQAGKAQKFADAGAEDVLGTADLSSLAASCPAGNACVLDPTSCPPGTCALDVDGDGTSDTGLSVEQSGGGTTPVTFASDKDTTTQLNLTNTSLSKVRISWNGGATIVYSIIHKNASGVVNIQQKGASDPDESPATCGLTGGVSNPSVSSPGVGTGSYAHSVDATGLSVGAGEELHIRLRPLCEDADIQVEGLNAAGAPIGLPNQGYKITSIGTYGEAEWTTEVTKMNPALPSIFDFAIFSDTSLTK